MAPPLPRSPEADSAGPDSAGPGAPIALSVTGLTKRYQSRSGEVLALDGVDLQVASGEVHGIIGRSGAGKSTLIRCLTLLDRPTSGSVSIGGEDLTHRSERGLRTARRGIGLVFQHSALLDSRTVAGNVAFPLEVKAPRARRGDSRRNTSDRLDRRARRARAGDLLDLVGLADKADAYPAELSGGQRQRVGIARALAGDPSILLCDEPTSALDAATTEEVLTTLLRLRAQLGVAIVVVTHEMDVVRRICDSVTVLDRGRVAESGPIARVVAAPGSGLARNLVPAHAVHVADGHRLIEVVFASDVTPTRSLLRELLAVEGLEVASASLWSIDGLGLGQVHLSVARDRVDAALEDLHLLDLEARLLDADDRLPTGVSP